MSQTYLAIGIKYNLISSPARTLLVSPTSERMGLLIRFFIGQNYAKNQNN